MSNTDNFKRASKLGLRILTDKGNLSVEQLWQLNDSDLTSAIRAHKAVVKEENEDELDFLEDKPRVDSVDKLRFEILKDVYLEKKSDRDSLKTAKEDKAFNAEIDNLIAEKKGEARKSLSIDELEKLRR